MTEPPLADDARTGVTVPPAVTLYAEFTALPGREAAVEELLRDLTARVRGEPGNLAFLAHHKLEDPAAFFVYEEYRDRSAFADHLAADYGARFNASLSSLIVEDASVLTQLVRL
ncbi:putative quinol monooxygenase [Glaciihabitans sp. dw_435]|uniref:putative quinol monooxygenase n=1 Tax=Glaciihabitans sp. dw_435 TaxID=2720081 RepID=UPI001BD575D1|nr:putative quinol monooxygenase [Glaciihabitans sp. dw_435]